ncbi:Pogo transposable element with KRAB domain [Nymphon striatum]|nr:Pogo transposable element with KRAB domain [Nymphon striatum]
MCHIQDSTKRVLKKLKTEAAVIPDGCTGLLQAPDVCWNKPFKAYYRELYEDWIATGPKQYTRGGNMKFPFCCQLATWVKQAWDKLPVDMIKKSIVVCGVSKTPMRWITLKMTASMLSNQMFFNFDFSEVKMENSKQPKTNVKALTALFAEKNEPIMGVKSTQSANLSKLPDSRVNAARKSLPPAEKPPIRTRKPVLPKTQPRKPPRSSIGLSNVPRSFPSSSTNELDKNTSKISPLEIVDIKKTLKDESTLELSKLDTIMYKTLPVKNDLYDSGSCTDIPTLSNAKCKLKIGGSENCLNKENFKKDLEEKIGSNPHLKLSNESLTNSNNNNLSNKYPRYRRVALSALCLSPIPPRKPMLPPDVHIALVRPIELDSPPPAPPRRLSKNLDCSPKLAVHIANFHSPPELMPRRNTLPDIEIKSPTSYSRPLRIVPSRPSPPPPVMQKLSFPNSSATPNVLNNEQEIYCEAEDPNRVSLIPEYTEEEELNDCAIYDDATSQIDHPPPVPDKPQPSNSLSIFQNLVGLNNGRPESYYQTPILHILPSSHEKELNVDNKEIKIKLRKEQKERERKEKEIAKAKKKYSLTGNETALDFGFIKESVRGKRSDLTVKKGERVIILRMENNPSGMWLVQNENGKVGYVELTNIEVNPESVKCVMRSHSTGDLIDRNSNDEYNYDDIDFGYTEEDEAIQEVGNQIPLEYRIIIAIYFAVNQSVFPGNA